MGMDMGALSFRHKGTRLLGVFGRPDGPRTRRFPGVLFLHGFPGSEHNVDIRRRLMAEGVASFHLHFMGAWGSGGQYRFSSLVEQAKAGLRFFSARPEIDNRRLAVFGYSMGGWAAIHLGARRPGLRGVAAVCPAGGEEMVTAGTRDFIKDASGVLNVRSVDALTRDFIRTVRAYDPAPRAARLRPPLLLVHGTADDLVPLSVSERIYAAARCEKTLLRAEGADHGFLDRRAWLARRTADWLKGRLSP